nr:MAG TPA: hypothetical protein [Caudoviricetes sp.]
MFIVHELFYRTYSITLHEPRQEKNSFFVNFFLNFCSRWFIISL